MTSVTQDLRVQRHGGKTESDGGEQRQRETMESEDIGRGQRSRTEGNSVVQRWSATPEVEDAGRQ